MNQIENAFRRNLIDFIRKSGQSSKVIAKKAGILPQNFSKYVNGRLVPNLSTVGNMAEALGITVSELLSDEGAVVSFRREQIASVFEKTLRQFVIFDGLSKDDSYDLAVLVEATGGWPKLLSNLREDEVLRQRGEENYQKVRADIARELSSRRRESEKEGDL
jgi:transcriptional regulator with XRE-family HTH domain